MLGGAYQGSVEEGEALDVEHVDLVDEEDAGGNLGLTLLTPLGNFGVDLENEFTGFWIVLKGQFCDLFKKSG
jgi:hypothetical protein